MTSVTTALEAALNQTAKASSACAITTDGLIIAEVAKKPAASLGSSAAANVAQIAVTSLRLSGAYVAAGERPIQVAASTPIVLPFSQRSILAAEENKNELCRGVEEAAVAAAISKAGQGFKGLVIETDKRV
eukprot:PhF_6_TR22185/c0_g1_i1/m.31322